jgi:hypothetical protein
VDGFDPRILNVGLDLAMAWGDDWLSPIQDRLARAQPELSRDDLDRYDEECRAAMDRGHSLVYDLSVRHELQPGDELWELFRTQALRQDAWISDDNLRHLYSQGCYYAAK